LRSIEIGPTTQTEGWLWLGVGRDLILCCAATGAASLPGAALQLAWVSADCPPAADGRVFEVRLLGPVRAVRLGREIALGGSKKRAVLALLLLEPGRVVPAGRLMEELWRGNICQFGQLIGAGGQAGMEVQPEPRQQGERLDTGGVALQAVHHGLRCDPLSFGENK
jgi:hypothetical protein